MFSTNKKLKRGVQFSTKDKRDYTTRMMDELEEKATGKRSRAEDEEEKSGLEKLKRELLERKRIEAENKAKLEKDFALQTRLERAHPDISRHVWLDIEILHSAQVTHKTKGRIVIELFSDLVPRTVRRFLDMVRSDSEPTYKGSVFSYIKAGSFCEAAPPKRAVTIYRSVLDETATRGGYHTVPGMLSLSDPGTSNAFAINITSKCAELDDGKNVIIGRVVHGMAMLLEIDKEGNSNGETRKKVTVVDCDEVDPAKPLDSYFKEPVIPDLKMINDPRRFKVNILPNVQACHWLRTG